LGHGVWVLWGEATWRAGAHSGGLKLCAAPPPPTGVAQLPGAAEVALSPLCLGV
jgi:hypothetical protein